MQKDAAQVLFKILLHLSMEINDKYFFFTEEAVIDWKPQKLIYNLERTRLARVRIDIKKAYPRPTYKL